MLSSPALGVPKTPLPRFDAAAAYETVRTIAAFGPREATGKAYRRAAAFVAEQFETLGYTVQSQRFTVPAGVSWGVGVPKGPTFNVIATPPELPPSIPYAIVGAHLDTVPQSPGGNDNGSGIAVMLELARLAALQSPPLPVIFVAFAAEEPRGGGDDDHHYGSRHYVTEMDAPARRGLSAMLALDRVGIGSTVRVCSGAKPSEPFSQTIVKRAASLGMRAKFCENRASDHWSFEKAGLRAARLLGEDDPGYHTARDLPRNVQRAQLARIGRLVWETVLALTR